MKRGIHEIATIYKDFARESRWLFLAIYVIMAGAILMAIFPPTHVSEVPKAPAGPAKAK